MSVSSFFSFFSLFCSSSNSRLAEVCFWNPDETGRIRRSDRVVNGQVGLSRFHEVVLHQGRAETFFLDAIRDSYGPTNNSSNVGAKTPTTSKTSPRRHIAVERSVIPASLTIDGEIDEETAYPVTVTLRHLTEAEATPTQVLSNVQDGLFRSNLNPPDSSTASPALDATPSVEEVVQCKYVVGCDGAHSWTRKVLGPEFNMAGEMTDYIWGVLDIIPITDFRMLEIYTLVSLAVDPRPLTAASRYP